MKSRQLDQDRMGSLRLVGLIETRPCTAMPQSKSTYHPDWIDGNHL